MALDSSARIIESIRAADSPLNRAGFPHARARFANFFCEWKKSAACVVSTVRPRDVRVHAGV